jgi:hypothetical protein
VVETTADASLRSQGRIEIITRAAGSGNPLSGGLFAVYRARDSRRVGELTTGVGGRVYMTAEPGMYFIRELRPTFGFLLETERIFLEVGTGETVVMELTKVRDLSIAYLPPDADGGGFIYITQTGQALPMLNYVGGGLLIAVAVTCGWFLLCEVVVRKKEKRNSLKQAIRRASHG